MLSYYAGSYHHLTQACVSGLKAYKRGYVYWYMHMIAGHFFKVQKSRMMLQHVCVHVHTVCVCGHVCTYVHVYVYMCVHIACMCKCLCASECTNVLSLLMQTIHACGVI